MSLFIFFVVLNAKYFMCIYFRSDKLIFGQQENKRSKSLVQGPGVQNQPFIYQSYYKYNLITSTVHRYL